MGEQAELLLPRAQSSSCWRAEFGGGPSELCGPGQGTQQKEVQSGGQRGAGRGSGSNLSIRSIIQVLGYTSKGILRSSFKGMTIHLVAHKGFQNRTRSSFLHLLPSCPPHQEPSHSPGTLGSLGCSKALSSWGGRGTHPDGEGLCSSMSSVQASGGQGKRPHKA